MDTSGSLLTLLTEGPVLQRSRATERGRARGKAWVEGQLRPVAAKRALRLCRACLPLEEVGVWGGGSRESSEQGRAGYYQEKEPLCVHIW